VNAKACLKSKTVFGYDAETDQDENNADVKELYHDATHSKPTKKLVVMGGLHGLDQTGVPSGQDPAEKAVTSFALDDVKMKKDTAINFTYKNLAKYTTKGSDMTPQRQKEVIELIKQYRDSGTYVVLLSWCFSGIWANANGL
jgi:hypothetical protein